MRAQFVDKHWLTGVLIVVVIAMIGFIGFNLIPSDSPKTIGDAATTAVETEVSEVTDSVVETAQTGVDAPISTSPSENVAHEAGANGDSNPWMVLALVAMALATAISVAVTFYLYRWRRILLASPHMLVPEKLGKWLERLGSNVDNLGSNVDNLAQSLESNVGKISQQAVGTDQRVANLVDTFMTLQQALDDRDAEIKRLKQGYDAEIFRRFVKRFIRVDQAVDDFMRGESVTPESLEQIKRILDDAFDECGVESFEPTVGDDYRERNDVADNPKLVEPEDPDDAFKIVEVLEIGYRVRTPEGHDVILPAKVKIYGTKN